jgi:hypothetical protein
MEAPLYSNKAGTYLGPVCTLAAITLALVIARIYTRLRRTGSLYLDDWLIVIAEVGLHINPEASTTDPSDSHCLWSACRLQSPQLRTAGVNP